MSAQCQRLFKEFEKYISASEEEQRRRLSDKLVSPEDYMSLRMGTSAVGIQLALLESVTTSRLATGSFTNHNIRYCEGIFLEPEVLDDKNLHIMWNQANVIISLWVYRILESMIPEQKASKLIYYQTQ